MLLQVYSVVHSISYITEHVDDDDDNDGFRTVPGQVTVYSLPFD